MRVRVIAEEPDVFERWAELQSHDAVEEPGGEALVETGRSIFFGAGGCISCHTIRGTPAAGVLGPDLTHVGSRSTIGAGVLRNTPTNMASWVKEPHKVKKGNLMLDMGLSDEQARDVAAYLGSLK